MPVFWLVTRSALSLVSDTPATVTVNGMVKARLLVLVTLVPVTASVSARPTVIPALSFVLLVPVITAVSARSTVILAALVLLVPVTVTVSGIACTKLLVLVELVPVTVVVYGIV